MHRNFGRRHFEDQPSMARINRPQAESLREKPTISVGVLAVQNEMGTKDHGHILSDLRRQEPEIERAERRLWIASLRIQVAVNEHS